MSGLYLHATLKVRHGRLEEFTKAYADQVPVLEGLGWKLVGGWTTIFGRVYTVVNVWEIPGADSFLESAPEWRNSAAGQAFRAVSAEIVEEETLTLLRSLPYSP
jgi:hypothetical protein